MTLEKIESQSPEVFSSIRFAINIASTAEEAHTLLARVHSAKAWAKAHQQIKQYRLDLLILEVEALVRTFELGGGDLLAKADRDAAEFLAAMTPAERAAMIAESGQCTTARGVVRVHLEGREAKARYAAGKEWRPGSATKPEPWDGTDRLASYSEVRAALEDVLTDYTHGEAPFTVAQVADELLGDLGLDGTEEPFIEGVREMCRSALRNQRSRGTDYKQMPLPRFNGVRLPRAVTVRTGADEGDDAGEWVRIPVLRARLSHMREMSRARWDQIVHDQRAAESLDQLIADMAEVLPNQDPTIEEILAVNDAAGGSVVP